MNTQNPIQPPHTSERLSRSDEVELAGFAAVGTVRAVEVAPLVLIGLLVCPPLAILVVLVVVPLLVMGLVVGLLAAVLTTPYLILHRLRGHRGHGSLLAHRLREAVRALVDLAPHRIAADVARVHPGR